MPDPPVPATLDHSPSLLDRFRGCLVGGAVGDALGAPIEFDTRAEIEAAHGQGGPSRLGRAFGVDGAITDDTQMTLWTAEGLLAAQLRDDYLRPVPVPEVVHGAYLRWLATQGEVPRLDEHDPDGQYGNVCRGGWLWEQAGLHGRRAPGSTCLAALRSGKRGSTRRPLNDSKGCGGVMRAAPAGLLYDPEAAFDVGCEVAAITHGHPSGWVAAGALAYAVAAVRDGADLGAALDGGAETADALAMATRLAESGVPDAEAVGALAVVDPGGGPGWVAEEALAVAALCARRHGENLERALRMAVTHSGDSDSTGAICGNLLGVAYGEQAIPARWTEVVELSDVVRQVADDLHACRTGASGWEARYTSA